MRDGEDGRRGLGLYIGEGRASGSSGISSIPRASAGGFGSAAAGSSEREKREVGERADERGPPGSGSERRRARAGAGGRPGGRRRALGLAWGRMASGLAGLARWLGARVPGPNWFRSRRVSACVCFFLNRTLKWS